MSDLSESLIFALADAGLIQFGAFEHGGRHTPYRLRLDLLPSYPALLKTCAGLVSRLLTDNHVERLLCTHDALPLGTAVSMLTSIPLVYSNGAAGNPVRNLVGAYDAGHPATLITLTTDFEPTALRRLIADAESVGLRVSRMVVLAETDVINNIRYDAVFNIRKAAELLAKRGDLPRALLKHVGR